MLMADFSYLFVHYLVFIKHSLLYESRVIKLYVLVDGGRLATNSADSRQMLAR